MPEVNDDLTLIGGTFTDSGEGNIDFYTFWYSVCYSLGLLNTYSEELCNIQENEIMLRRFLESKGIILDSRLTIEQMYHIYTDWVGEIKKRGTIKVSDLEGQVDEIGLRDIILDPLPIVNVESNSGVCLRPNNLPVALPSSIALGRYFTVSFSTVFKGNSSSVDTLLFSNSNFHIRVSTDDIPVDDIISVSFYINIDGVSESNICTCDLSINTLYDISIAVFGDHVRLYSNDELIAHIEVSTLSYNFDTLLNDYGLLIGGMKCEVRDEEFNALSSFSWNMNVGSGFTVPCSNTDFYASIQGLDSDDTWGDIWVIEHIFQNAEYNGLRGELARLINYGFGEFIYALIRDSELGLTVDVCSPISEEASCFNMNKLLGKSTPNQYYKLALFFNTVSMPSLDSEGFVRYSIPIGDTTFFGLNASLLNEKDWRVNGDYKPNGIIPFLPIPVANYQELFDGYEVSFVIKSEESIDLKFGILAYDENLEYISDVLVNYSDDGINEYFLDIEEFDLTIGREVWIRGVFSPNLINGVADNLNIGLGNNLYSRDLRPDFRFIVPFIAFRNNHAQEGVIAIKDIVVRPLTLPTSKGIIYPKNEIVFVADNKSGDNERKILDELDKLIPYNSTVNFQNI